jgi:low affinity Fe/Cu permease
MQKNKAEKTNIKSTGKSTPKKNLWYRTYNYFDKFEDGVRGYLSKRPILYTFIGGVAIVLFWRGIWHTADLFPWLTGPMSILISVVILLATGLFVSYFVGDMIIISGLHKDKKLAEKTEEEIEKEEHAIDRLEDKIDSLTKKIDNLEDAVEK